MQKRIFLACLLPASVFLASCKPTIGASVPPVLTEVEPIGTTASQTPTYRFGATFGGSITYGGPCTSTTTQAHIDINEVTFNTLPGGVYNSCTIKVTTVEGVASSTLTITPFTITNANLNVIQGATGIPSITGDNTPAYSIKVSKTGTTSIAYGGSCSSPTTSVSATANVDIPLTFNLLPDGTYSNCTINVTSGANGSAGLFIPTFTVKTIKPILAEVTPVVSPTINTTPSYTFSTNEGGAITYGGDCSSPTTTAVIGNNTITFNALSATTHSNCTINVTDVLGNQSLPLMVKAFTINRVNISSIVPAVLSAGFETRVSGYKFSTLSSLLINGSAVTPTLVNDHEIRFIAPALTAGTYTMNINTADYGSTSASVTFKANFLPEQQMAVGGTFACSRKTDGSVWCWGNNTYGQLGNATTVNSEVPVQVSLGSGITASAITAGDNHACAAVSGTGITGVGIKCWGRNGNGQLGNNATSTGSTATPVLVKDIAGTGTLTGVLSLSAGTSHTCAVVTGGSVNCWGLNSSGQLGDNTTAQKTIPVAVKDIAGTGTLGTASAVTAISAGANHTCALLTSTGVNCWGYNRYGSLGNNTTTASPYAVPLPVEVKGIGGTGTLTTVTGLSGGLYHTCAVLTSGNANCWGYNGTGQLGDNSTTNRSSPVAVKGVGGTGTLTLVSAISSGQYHTCARLTDNSAKCWGRNFVGQLGDNSVTQRNSPVAVAGVGGTGSLGSVSAIGVGPFTTCAKFSDNSIKCWGDVTQYTSGSYVLPSISNAASISFGTSHACALLTDKTVKCWGLNSSGQLGDASTTDSASPVLVKGVGGTGTLSNVKAITVGATHNCALLDTTGNNVVCWGANGNGQLGDTTLTTRTSPVTLTNISNATSVSAADTHTCASLADGTAKCWGNNNATYGKLGDGSGSADNSTPVLVKAVGGVGNLANVVSVSVGTSHSCAVLNTVTNNLRCWGRNDLGQLGDTTTTHRTTPVAVVGVGGTGNLDNVASVRLGGNHTCALLTDNTVKCWGYNTNGQVGDGSVVQKTSPVAILDKVSSLGVDGVQTCARLLDKTAKCWGHNVYGQLGDNTLTQKTSPVTVLNLWDIVSIEPGTNRTCALLTDGAVICTGLIMDKIRAVPDRSEVLP